MGRDWEAETRGQKLVGRGFWDRSSEIVVSSAFDVSVTQPLNHQPNLGVSGLVAGE